MSVTDENYSFAPFLLLGTIGYATYYYLTAKSKPTFHAKEGSVAQFFLKYCPILTEEFHPTPWCFTGRFQTILRPLLKSFPKIVYKKEVVSLPDAGEVHLHWTNFSNDDSDKHRETAHPIAIIMPGLTGCSCANYIIHIAKRLAERGYRVAVFNNRGVCDSVLRTPKGYCASYTNDAAFVFNYIKKNNPNSPMIAIGISLGGMILYNYLATVKRKEDCPLNAALAVSVIWDPSVSAVHMENPLDWFLFNRVLTKYLVNFVRRNASVLQNHFDVGRVMKVKTVKEFDENLTIKMFGYDHVEDYYAHVRLQNKLHDIAVPLLCLAAEDDPFVPRHTVPVAEIAKTENVAIVLTKRGGHIGFMEGWFPRHKNYMDRIACEFADAVFNNLSALDQFMTKVDRH